MSSKSLTILIIVIIVALVLLIYYAAQTPSDQVPVEGTVPTGEASSAPEETPSPTTGTKPSSQAPVLPQQVQQVQSATKDISSLEKELQGLDVSDSEVGQVDSELTAP